MSRPVKPPQGPPGGCFAPLPSPGTVYGATEPLPFHPAGSLPEETSCFMKQIKSKANQYMTSNGTWENPVHRGCPLACHRSSISLNPQKHINIEGTPPGAKSTVAWPGAPRGCREPQRSRDSGHNSQGTPVSSATGRSRPRSTGKRDRLFAPAGVLVLRFILHK